MHMHEVLVLHSGDGGDVPMCIAADARGPLRKYPKIRTPVQVETLNVELVHPLPGKFKPRHIRLGVVAQHSLTL